MEWKPSSPGELPDRYTDTACEYIDEEPSSPRYEGERQVVAVFTDPNTNKQFKSKPVPYNSLVSSKMARMGYKKACRLAKQQARKSLEENNVKITKNELADIILEETRAIVRERQTTASDVIRVALGNAQLLKLLGAGSRGVLASVKEGGQLNLLVGLITNALTCPDGSDAIDRHNRPRCKRTVLNPEMDKGLLADTYNKIKNFEEDQRGDSADALADLEDAIMQENKSTGLDHAQKLAREVMRMFYDNNERDGIVSALMNAGNIDGAEKAVLARRAVDDLVDTLEGNEQQENLEEAKNCGCGQDPCITYGKIKEGNVKMKMTKSKLQQIILEEAKKAIEEGKYGITRDGRRCKCGTEGCGGAACSDDAIEEGAVPGQISGGDLVAAITLAIDEVFQDTRPDHEAAAIAYAQISNSLDEIFRQSYKASARLGKMMGGSPEEPGELGGLGLE